MTTTYTTWDDAARAAVDEIAQKSATLWLGERSFNKFTNPIQEVKYGVNHLRAVYFPDENLNMPRSVEIPEAVRACLTLTGSAAYHEYTAFNVYRAPEVHAEELAELLARKQHDYGPENINAFGIKGLVVRLNDKLARLENLLRRHDKAQSAYDEALNEPLADTWLDIVGYCAIGLMLLDRTFGLPLAQDLPTKYPTIREYDPELERLLAEEDEIEARINEGKRPEGLGYYWFERPDDHKNNPHENLIRRQWTVTELRRVVNDTVTGGAIANEWLLGVLVDQGLIPDADGLVKPKPYKPTTVWNHEDQHHITHDVERGCLVIDGKKVEK